MKWYGKRVRVVIPDHVHNTYTDALVPMDALSLEALQKIPEGATARVEASVPRNKQYHRFYWAMLGTIKRNLPEGVTLDLDALHQVVKLGAGCKHIVKLPNGAFYELPGSIAFDRMDETAFRQFMDNAIKFVVSDLVPGMDSEVLENELYNLLAGGG